jgi:phenylacetate-CoA ligase
MLIIRGVNVFPSQIESVLATMPDLAPHYILEVSRPSQLDELDVIVETRNEADAEAQAMLARQAEHLIKALIGVTSTVRPVLPGMVERSQGKARRVIDKRPKV